jgi:hypothetical protein
MQPAVRRWVHRAVVIVGAAASIATPQKKWMVEAKLPAYANDISQARELVVSATREPELHWTNRDGTWGMLDPVQPTSWPGTAHYKVPAGAQIDRLLIAKGCPSGCSSGKCEPPADEYVRVDRVEHASWTLEAPVRTTDHLIGNDVHLGRVIVTVEATRAPTVEVETIPETRFVPTVTALDGNRFAIEFRDYGGTSGIKYRWPIHARITGPCADAACAVPAPEHVTITGVADE